MEDNKIRRAVSGVALASLLLMLPAEVRAANYRDYDTTFVPKSERRRVALSVVIDRGGVDRGSTETKTLHAMILARFTGVSELELLPRIFVNPDDSMMAKLRALEADDLLELRLDKMRPPLVGNPERKGKNDARYYTVEGSLAVKNVMTGAVVAEQTLEKLLLPDVEGYADELDGMAASLMALTAHMLDFYQKQQVLISPTPRGNAVDAAKAAESAGNWEEAALILGDITRKDPSKEAELRDRRDLATMRSGKSTASGSSSGSGEKVGLKAPGRIDLMDPANRGKLFPVSQGSIPIRSGITTDSWAVSVSVLMKDAGAKGGLMIASRTKNIYIGILGNSNPKAAQLNVEVQNLVTGSPDTRTAVLPPGVFGLDKLMRIEARYDAGALSISVNGGQLLSMPRVPLDNVGLFVFGKLSTVYVQDATILQ